MLSTLVTASHRHHAPNCECRSAAATAHRGDGDRLHGVIGLVNWIVAAGVGDLLSCVTRPMPVRRENE